MHICTNMHLIDHLLHEAHSTLEVTTTNVNVHIHAFLYILSLGYLL